ncbi:hypothetical protein LK459_14250 [Gordonia otitidis]|uniref:hypothetical protein n=1 Tax=Gordonia otitidis TaxID=249058 RepID=UPI001D152380|nr:hypothetical protein [Gordonia otitidis]UEA57772.1 hypothetical protein LK459_14250 [Gordonia otitidis]
MTPADDDPADGTEETADGTADPAEGTEETADGTGDLAEGTGDLAEGTGDLAEGTGDLAEGTADLADGTGDSAEGTGDPAEGTADLADGTADTADRVPAPEDRGETLFVEQGGSWWVVAIGPVLAGAVLVMDIVGPGRVHWLWISILGAIITLFSIVQVYAARRHVGVELTEATLQQGTLLMPLADIDTVYPANNGSEHEKWESAPALGELAGVPRRRKGVGVKLIDGKLAQAWARDVERFRQELTEAHLAVKLGVGPGGPEQ